MKEILVLLNQTRSDGIQKLVVGAIITNNNKVLVLRRKLNDFMGGLVELPSGKVEENESLLDALAREVKEETGLTIQQVVSFVDSFDYLSSSGKKSRQFNFLVTVVSSSPVELTEHDAYYWIESKDIPTYNISAHTTQTIQKGFKLLKKTKRLNT